MSVAPFASPPSLCARRRRLHPRVRWPSCV